MPSRREHPFTLDALEPRTLLAAAPITFTDGDGTEVRITLSGNGDMALVGDDLQLTGTDQGTRLTLTARGGADGRATLDDITSDGALQQINGKILDLTGDITLAGSAKTLKLGDFLPGSGHTLTLGGTEEAKPVSITLKRVADLSLDSGMPIKSLKVDDWEDNGGDNVITAPEVDKIDSKEDLHVNLRLQTGDEGEAELGKVTVDEALSGDWFVDGKAKSIKAGSITTDFLAAIAGDLDKLESDGDFSGTVAATSINKVTVDDDLDHAMILAGADLGDDGQFGGAGDNEDLFFRGTMGNVMIKGQVIDSVLASGLDPANGVFGDGDDFITGKNRSTIGRIKVNGTADNDSVFAAGDFKNVNVGNTNVDPAGDPRFLLASTDPDEDPPVIEAALANDTGDPNDGITSDPEIHGRVTDLGRVASFRVGIDDMELEDFEGILNLLEPNGTFELERAKLEQINEGPFTAGLHTIHFVARDEVGNTSAIFTVAFVFAP
jgi:hypothetical protein